MGTSMWVSSSDIQLVEIRDCSEGLHSCSMFSKCSFWLRKIASALPWSVMIWHRHVSIKGFYFSPCLRLLFRISHSFNFSLPVHDITVDSTTGSALCPLPLLLPEVAQGPSPKKRFKVLLDPLPQGEQLYDSPMQTPYTLVTTEEKDLQLICSDPLSLTH